MPAVDHVRTTQPTNMSYPLSNLIIAEGDTGIARFFCGHCGQSFRAEMDRVTMFEHVPLCLTCIDEANPKRAALGYILIPVDRDSYYPD